MSKIPNSVIAVGQRMVRAFASTVLATSVIGGGFDVFGGVDYKGVIGVGLGAAVVSLLMSLAGVAGGGGPAFGDVERVKPDGALRDRGAVGLVGLIIIVVVIALLLYLIF